jgi:hypothetical protein
MNMMGFLDRLRLCVGFRHGGKRIFSCATPRLAAADRMAVRSWFGFVSVVMVLFTDIIFEPCPHPYCGVPNTLGLWVRDGRRGPHHAGDKADITLRPVAPLVPARSFHFEGYL